MSGRLVACLALAALFVAPPAARAIQPGAPRTMVMPFDNPSGDPRLYWLSEGSAVLVTRLLDDIGEPTIDRDERLRAFERLQLPPAAALSHATVIKVGQLVRAGELIVGSYEVVDDILTVRARVIDLETGHLVPESIESGPLSEMVAIYARVVRTLEGAAAPVPTEAPILASPAAFEAYIKGLVAETPARQLGFLQQAFESAPDDAVRIALAEALDAQGNHQRAMEVLARVDPDGRWGRQAQYRTAVSLISLERLDEAFAVLQSLETGIRSAVVLNALGVVQLRRGPSAPGEKAAFFFTEATKVEPAQADYFFNLGYAYWCARDPQAAIYWLREAVRRDPADVGAHDALGAVLQQTGATAEAARERELAKRLSASNESRHTSLAAGEAPRGLDRLGDRLEREGARVDATIAASDQRDSADVATFHLDAARRAFAREADREAEKELERAIFLSPYLAEAHLLLGRVYLRGGRIGDAIETLKIAVWSNETAAARVALAEAYLQVQNVDAARAEVDRALELDPGSVDAKKLRAKLGAPEARLLSTPGPFETVAGTPAERG